MEKINKVETREQRRRHPFLFIQVLEESFDIKFSLIGKARILFTIFFN
jgi:hypothetical protein